MNNKTISKKYIKANIPGATHLKTEVYYSLGGVNYFTYKNEPRGYYVSVSPVTREAKNGVSMESYAAFSGVKKLIVPATRQTKKKEQEAKEYFDRNVDSLVREWFPDMSMSESE